MKIPACVCAALAFACAASLAAQQAPPREPLASLRALNAIEPDPSATYHITSGNRIELRRGEAKILLEDGYLTFLTPLDGQVTGAVFSGRGHIIAMLRDPVEKQQIANFLGAPVVDQEFQNACFRFTDDTAAELLRDLQSANITPQANTAMAANWQAPVLARNPSISFRILSESFSESPRHFFSANFGGTVVGPFDFVLDEARDEPQLFGQGKSAGGLDYFDVWSSYRLPGTSPVPQAFAAPAYKIETAIRPDNSITGTAAVHIRVLRSGERMLTFQLANPLRVQSVTRGQEALFAFPDETINAQERASSANGLLFIVLPAAAKAGDEFDLTFHYHGNVIRDAGNGVLFVGARDTWYPHLGDTAAFATYELTFHWPRKLRLAATGTKLDEREDGDTRSGHWRTEKPSAIVGFNLGEYAYASIASADYSVDVYANRQLEQALLTRLHQPELDDIPGLGRFSAAESPAQAQRMRMQAPEASPADALKQLAREIDSSIRFYESYSGKFPVRQLNVSQIPGTFGQGWPGLLYISTYSFLPADTQQRAGLNATGQEHFRDLVPFHEVAHQWWGNVVGWSSYRDQWIDEGLCNYLAVLFADNQKSPDHKLRLWLDRYRQRLVQKEGDEQAPADVGSIVLGSRLDSSHSPNGFDEIVYDKGTWIFHMIREMLRDPSEKNPDARFEAFLHTLQGKYAYRALSTDDLQRELEAVMTPAMGIESRHSMEWFFADWVRGTGVPHYRIEASSTRHTDKGFVVSGKLKQTGVPAGFVAPVPIYGSGSGYLGRVIASGPQTSFHFVSQRDPGKLSIDPRSTLLCVSER